MIENINEFGQPIGKTLIDWQDSLCPERSTVTGNYCRIVPLQLDEHLESLFTSFRDDLEGPLWTYMGFGPFEGKHDFKEFIFEKSKSMDPLFYVVEDIQNSNAIGLLSLMRIKSEMGIVEIGNIIFSESLQKTVMATEAIYLMIKNVFEVCGYRRFEWKCDALNEPSRKAAKRFGFQFEGVFRQGMIYKNRTRDTAWFSIIDSEWIDLRQSFEAWLLPINFNENGFQKISLNEIIK